MPLFVGDKLRFYEILTPIGKGGMGEAYRVSDSRLSWDVVIKVSNSRSVLPTTWIAARTL
jgi:serine/threonine protein kinase